MRSRTRLQASGQQVSSRARLRAVRLLSALATITVSAGVLAAFGHMLFREPQHTSILTGERYLRELVNGNDNTFYDMLGMGKTIFWSLLQELVEKGGLRNSRWVSAAEKLATFLYQSRTSVTIRPLKNRWQHSSETISRNFHEVLDAIVSPGFYKRHVRLPPDACPPEIRHNPKLYPFFKDVRSTVDGSLYEGHFSADTHARFRCRKGFLAQNVLICANFDMKFAYILPGWEGSAADGRLWEDARQSDLRIPAGRYYLADAGFPSCDALLVPYRGVRYHLKEWSMGAQRPQNPKELFNLRHATARNIVERILGISKREFPLVTHCPEYDPETQAKLVCAMGAIFNFIRSSPDGLRVRTFRNDSRRTFRTVEGVEVEVDDNVPVGVEQGELHCGYISQQEKDRADRRRDRIAQEMWDSYVTYMDQ